MFAKEEILALSHPGLPFYLNLPSQSLKPVDELVKFFKNYKHTIKSLLNYTREISLVKEFESNLHVQIIQSVDPKVTSPGISNEKRPNLLKAKTNSSSNLLFNGNNNKLLNTVNTAITSYHQNQFHQNHKNHKELTHKIIPRLENLLKNLNGKIKEIKSSLKNESFANDSIVKEISKTGAVLKKYTQSVEIYSTKHIDKDFSSEEDEQDDPQLKKMDDPFLIKLQLNHQLKNQLVKENYIFAAYINLQNISKDLLIYVIKDLNSIVEKLEKVTRLNLPQLNADSEWQNFISNNSSFVNIYATGGTNPKKEIRHLKNIMLPYATSIHNKCIRFGIIYKKSKVLKNYNRFYYLLTCNYLHEFKVEEKETKSNKLTDFINHNDIPIKSYNLNNYQIVIKNEKNFKFNLVKLSTNKTTSFKTNNATEFNNWTKDLGDLLKFESDNMARFEFVERKLKLKSISTSTLSLPAMKDSLQGVFTPKIVSPSSSGSDKNPFDHTFNSYVPTAVSPAHSEGSTPTGQSTPAATPVSLEHQNYLKLQQEYLNQQQELIKLKLQTENKLAIPRTSSASSLVSMESSVPESKINSFLQQNENLIPQFFITDHHDGDPRRGSEASQ